jgi:hypothetical protein
MSTRIVAQDILAALTPAELEALRNAIESVRKQRLQKGTVFDFFGSARLDLDSVFVSLEDGEEAVKYFESKTSAQAA